MMEKNYRVQIKDYTFRQAWPVKEKTALLVIDMQIFFASLSKPILGNVISLIDVCRARKVEIFFTRHGHRDPKKDGGMLGKWWQDLIQYGSAEWEIINELTVSPHDTIVDKNRYSAFFNTDLDRDLKAHGVEDLVICGVMTNCCCETTARDAFIRDYRVFFVADATAAANEELHVASLKNLAYGFAYIIDTKALCQNIKYTLK
jgi:isochorismate hydrolase